MKKVLLTLLVASTCSISLLAQDNKQREVGLIFSNLDNFGLVYRFGTERSLWRTSALLLSGYNNDQVGQYSDIHSNGNGFNFRFGKEFRKEIANKLMFRYGGDVSFTFQRSEYEFDDKTSTNYDHHTKSKTFSPGISFVVGLNYQVGENLLIGAELLPGVSFTTGTTLSGDYIDAEERDISAFSYGLSSSSAALSLVYKF